MDKLLSMHLDGWCKVEKMKGFIRKGWSKRHFIIYIVGVTKGWGGGDMFTPHFIRAIRTQ